MVKLYRKKFKTNQIALTIIINGQRYPHGLCCLTLKSNTIRIRFSILFLLKIENILKFAIFSGHKRFSVSKQIVWASIGFLNSDCEFFPLKS